MGWIAGIGKRGGTITQPPPGGGGGTPDYGPLDGVAAVKADSAVQAVTDPGGGTTFTTLADLQNKVNNTPGTGNIFVHAAGGQENWTSTLNCGTKAPKIYFLGLAGSTSTTISGGGLNNHGIISAGGSPFEVHGGMFTGFGANADAGGASPVRAIRVQGPNALVEDCIVTDSHIGLSFTADATNAIARRVRAHSCHKYGMSGSGVTGATVTRCRIENNNTEQLGFGDAGGTKFAACTNITLEYNWVFDNFGEGLWADGSFGGFLIKENVTEDNYRSGIFYELSHGGTIIRRNASYRDTQANTEVTTRHTRSSILLSESDGTLGPGTGIQVVRNIVDTTNWPLFLFDTDNRSMVMTDCDVTNNDFYLRSNSSRIGNDDVKATHTMHTDSSITWNTNRYNVLSLSNQHWYHPTASIDSEQLSWSGWQGKGFDAAGARELI